MRWFFRESPPTGAGSRHRSELSAGWAGPSTSSTSPDSPCRRRSLVGSGRRNDERFIARLVRHRASARPRALSARAIIWANQPRRWRKARALLPGGEQLGIRIDGPLTKLSEIPTLVLWGDEDRVISASDARRCKELPPAQVRIAHGVGHSLPLEVAGWANDHIAKFVAGLTTTELRAA